jgi:hypothetical protein
MSAFVCVCERDANIVSRRRRPTNDADERRRRTTPPSLANASQTKTGATSPGCLSPLILRLPGPHFADPYTRNERHHPLCLTYNTTNTHRNLLLPFCFLVLLPVCPPSPFKTDADLLPSPSLPPSTSERIHPQMKEGDAGRLHAADGPVDVRLLFQACRYRRGRGETEQLAAEPNTPNNTSPHAASPCFFPAHNTRHNPTHTIHRTSSRCLPSATWTRARA